MHKFLTRPERAVNTWGYKQLSAKRIPDAILVFQVDARAHPNSWNARDSLGETYLDAGAKDAVLKAYRRSLQLSPDNRGATQAIELTEGARQMSR